MKDKVGTQDQISFVLNGKPIEPPKQPDPPKIQTKDSTPSQAVPPSPVC